MYFPSYRNINISSCPRPLVLLLQLIATYSVVRAHFSPKSSCLVKRTTFIPKVLNPHVVKTILKDKKHRLQKMMEYTHSINLAPKAEFESPPPDRRNPSKHGPGSPVLSRSTVSSLLTRFSNLRHTVVVHNRQPFDEEMHQSKMRVLTKNPALFREFKARLSQSQEQCHSNVGVSMVLHDFLTNDLRIPELRDEIIHCEEDQENRPVKGLVRGRARRRLGLLASYLGSPNATAAGKCDVSKSSLLDDTCKVHQVSKTFDDLDMVPSLEMSETSCSSSSSSSYSDDEVNLCDDSVSTASF